MPSTLSHERAILRSGAAGPRRESLEHTPRILPGPRMRTNQRCVTSIRVAVESAKVGNDPGSKRVQVKVPDKFEKIRLLVNHDGLVPVLEEVAAPAVPPVKGACVACEEGSHRPG
jgi:hypothetical protein